ncbi:unnamed protein product [Phytophthora fragariaefolia]|uniref:Unnamed protein product n=1 Tax=Phytophthora fragariaefolia TaxID=1490495 RepID=A0A9W6XRB1_9STRA|nr:unnamed protein product [Phytophthora fragariaefolia]
MLYLFFTSRVDAAFAVFLPALVLFYSLFVFQDDLKMVKIRQRFFPPRIFERKARNYVSPKELNMFSTDFESLLIRSAWDIFLKLSFSLLACFRWGKITMLLLQRERKSSLSSHSRTGKSSKEGLCSTTKSSKNCTAVTPILGSAGPIIESSARHRVRCVQYSFVWTPGASNDVCKCLAYVDRDLAPADADNLVDVTQTLADMASAGNLETVQLVNRKIYGSLPDELQLCRGLRNLRRISIVDIDIFYQDGVPVRCRSEGSMFVAFANYFDVDHICTNASHIEGDSSDNNLVELPSDLFASMTTLHTIHLSYHPILRTLPSLENLPHLECVYFGYLDSIREIPSTGDLPALQVMALEGLPLVSSLPDVAQYGSTLEMVFVQDVPACCSGFLSEGDCNTTFPSCCGSDDSLDDSRHGSGHDSLPRTCLDMPEDESLLPSDATLSFLNQFASNISNFCDAAQATCPIVTMTVKLNEYDTCDGVLYRKCTSESKGTGICFNKNMGRVQCTYSQATIDMRKEEIASGCSCNKVEEQWLGCA